MPFLAGLDDTFVWEDRFLGDPDFAEYGVVGTPAASAQGNGVLLSAAAAPGNGLHNNNNFNLDPLNLLGFGFAISLDEAISGAGVGDGNSVWVGIQNGNYNTDPTTSTKSIFLNVPTSGAASKLIYIYAKDGVRTYNFATPYSLKNVPTKFEVNLAEGWANVQITIDGRPVFYQNDNRLNLSNVGQADWFQHLIYMKPKATGQPTNNLRCHHMRFNLRSMRTITRPPSTM